jgi:hypothetical protein
MHLNNSLAFAFWAHKQASEQHRTTTQKIKIKKRIK